MRILGLSGKDSGCGYHRVLLPIAFMPDFKRLVTDAPDEEIINRGWDLLLYNRVCALDNDWQFTKSNMGVKVVMDIDDDWILPPNHIANHNYKLIKDRIIHNIREADLMTTTSERLADKVAKYNTNIQIFPNALPYGLDQFTYEREPSEYVRLFWCGSLTHNHDIEILRNPLKRIDNKNVQMVMGGYNSFNKPSREIWDRMASSFTNNQKINFKILTNEPPTQYMAMYQEADIALIPLEKSDWHSCKSNLKVLEAAAKKIPCIVSAVSPYYDYKDCPVLWVHNQKDWFKHINYLVKNEKEREKLGAELFEWANEKFNFRTINERRKAAFESLVKP